MDVILLNDIFLVRCSVHVALTSLLLLMRFTFLSGTVVLCQEISLHSIFVSPLSVFKCWLFATSFCFFCNVPHPLPFICFYIPLNLFWPFPHTSPLLVSWLFLIMCWESFDWFLPYGLQGSMIRRWSMVSFSYAVYQELFLQPPCTPSPLLESHALFPRLHLLVALHPQAPAVIFSSGLC